jgi:hypothetical protein
MLAEQGQKSIWCPSVIGSEAAKARFDRQVKAFGAEKNAARPKTLQPVDFSYGNCNEAELTRLSFLYSLQDSNQLARKQEHEHSNINPCPATQRP